MNRVISLPRSAPEAEGVSSEVVLSLVNRLAELDSLHSIMLMRHGRVIAEGWWHPYRPETRHHLFSLSKSFTSAAVGMAMADGLFRLDDPVVTLFPEKVPAEISEKLSRMTVRHLLTMSTGHDRCVMSSFYDRNPGADWVRTFLSVPPVYEPGTHFVYNSGASFMLSALVQKFSGKTLVEYLTPRLFEPLGIVDPFWQVNEAGVNLGGWGLWLRTEEIAKFAELLRRGGEWDGRQLIPADYLCMATSFQMDNSANDSPDWKLGYGFQFWRSQHNSYRADGACGQFALVIPDYDITLATTGGLSNMQNVLSIVWETLLPGVKRHGDALPEHPAAHQALLARLADLHMPLAKGDLTTRITDGLYRVSGRNLPGITGLQLSFERDSCVLVFDRPAGRETLHAGFGFNCENMLQLNEPRPRHVAASAAWVAPDVLEIDACYYETPYQVKFRCELTSGGIRLVRSSNLQFLNPDWEIIEGVSI